jgi:hypothetical protein
MARKIERYDLHDRKAEPYAPRKRMLAQASDDEVRQAFLAMEAGEDHWLLEKLRNFRIENI